MSTIDQTLTRIPPNDHALEVALLGALILDPRRVSVVRGLVRPEDLYDPAHATVYTAILAVADRGDAVSVVTLSAELRRRERLNTVGGAQALVDLTDAIHTTAHVEDHARHLGALAAARRVQAAAERIAAEGYARTLDAGAYPARAAQALADAARGAGAKGVVSVFDVCGDAFELLLRPAMMPPAPSGVGTLDKAVRLRGPQLVILAARPAMGKSALALQYAIATARAGRAVLFVSQEMRPAELVSRALLASAGLRAEDVERGVDAKQHAALLAVAETLATLPIAFTRALDVSADDVAAEALRQHARSPLGLVVIDYLTLLRKPKADREDLAVGAMTRRLKLLAMELGCPVLVLAQLNRECEKRPDKRPHLSDLRQSGDVEQDADVVLFVYRDEVYKPDTKDPGIGEIIARKVRAGSPGTVRLGWDGPATRFYDLEPTASSPPAREDERWAPPVEDEAPPVEGDDARPQDEVSW